jgi:hypothetical protein
VPVGTNEELRIFVEGNANLQVTDLVDDVWKVTMGSSTNQKTSSFFQFISSVIGYTKLLLESLPNEQIFKRSWNTKILLPETATLLNSEELNGKSWRLDYGYGTFLESTLTISDDSEIILNEIIVVTETSDINPTAVGSYKSFEIEYLLPDSPTSYDTDNSSPPAASLSWEDDIFNWDESYDDTWSEGPVSVNIHIQMNADVTIHLDTEKTWVKPTFHAEGSFDIIFSAEYVYDPDPLQIFYRDWWIDIQLGYVPVIIHVEVSIELRFLFEAEGEVIVNTGFQADAWFKAGAEVKFDLWKWKFNWDEIWDHDFTTSYTEPTVTHSARIFIRPSICFPIKAKVYGIFGPVVTPELYLEGVLKYTNELFWYFKIGFCISAGVCLGIPYVWDECWEWKIDDWTIRDFGSTTPSKDTQPPHTTLLMFSPPMYPVGSEWCTGKYLFFFFQAIDKGDVPSGVDYTKFKVAENDWMNYNYPDLWLAELTADPGYYNYGINWYSVDNFGHQESTHTYIVNVELVPPNSEITVGDPHHDDHVIAEETPITLEAEDVDEANNFPGTGWKIWFRLWHEGDGWTDWYNGDANTPVVFYFTQQAIGNCIVEWCAMDGVWNVEDVHSQGFVVEGDNQKPNKPSTPSGPTKGNIGLPYTYETSATDPDGHDIQYGWDWNGEDIVDEGSELKKNGSTESRSHIWTDEGTYNVKVKAKDRRGAEGPWSDPLAVTITDEQITLEIIKPTPGIYILGRQLGINLKRLTIVVGPIQLIAEAECPSGIEKVDFYIDDKLLESDPSPPYSCHWFGLYSVDNCELEITAHSNLGQKKTIAKDILRII